MDSHERAVMLCLAMKDEAREIVDFLAKTATQASSDCEHVATPW
jgi:hypothetical protein